MIDSWSSTKIYWGIKTTVCGAGRNWVALAACSRAQQFRCNGEWREKSRLGEAEVLWLGDCEGELGERDGDKPVLNSRHAREVVFWYRPGRTGPWSSKYIDFYETTALRVFFSQVFQVPLEKEGQLGGPILAPEEIKTIFGSIPDILDVHVKMKVSFKICHISLSSELPHFWLSICSCDSEKKWFYYCQR